MPPVAQATVTVSALTAPGIIVKARVRSSAPSEALGAPMQRAGSVASSVMVPVTGDVPEVAWDPLPSVTVQVSSGCRGGAAHLDVECPDALAQGDGQRAVRDGDVVRPPTSSASVVAVEQPKVIVLPLITASVTVNGMSIVPR